MVFDPAAAYTINLKGALPTLLTNMTIQGPGMNVLTVRRDTGGDYRIFNSANVITNISGMTLTNGKAADGASGNDGTVGEDGGGIKNSGTMTLTNVSVVANTGGKGGNGVSFGGPGGSGGGISNSSNLTMTNCIVSGNTGGRGGDGNNRLGDGGDGGGIFNQDTLTLTDCVVDGNTGGRGGDGSSSFGGNGGRGGGIYSANGLLTLTNATISNNKGGDNGIVSGSGGFGGHGGGLFIQTGAVQMTNSTVSGNNAGLSPAGSNGYAGGISNGGAMTVVGSTISGNTARNAGGGILNRLSLNMTNSTVSGNSSLNGNVNGSIGGGIENDSPATLTLTNCTINGNVAASNVGNGVDSNSSPGPTVRNTIIAGNGPGGNGPDTANSFNSQGNNIIGYAPPSMFGGPGFTNGVNGDQVGTSTAPINPRLGPLANNGGPTRTHSLLTGSPAIDAGNNTIVNNAGLTTDQCGPGFPRVFDGPDADTIAIVDIGAYELQLSMEDIADKTTNEDTQLSFSFGIGGATAPSASATASSSNQLLVPDANLIITGTGSARTLQITPLPNQSGTTTITVTINDGTLTISDTFVLTVNSVNDAPTLDALGDVTISEDASTQSVSLTGITTGAGEAQALTVTATSGNTSVIPNPAVTYVSPNSTGSLIFTPVANASGSAIITVTVTDDGGTVNGGINSFSRTFNVMVNAVNDAPVNTVPGTQTASENTPLFFSTANNNRISVADIDAGSSPLQVTLSAPNGTVTLSGTLGLSFTTGDGVSDSTMTFTGPLLNINNALSALAFTSTQGFNGATTLTLLTSDLGNTGSGGAQTASSTINITVNNGGALQFSSPTYTATEGSGQVSITVTRTGGTAGVAQVSYATSNGTAIAGSDYFTVSGTLTLDDGIASQTLIIPINNDSLNEPDETFNLTLSNPLGSGELGSPVTAVVTITNDDTPSLQLDQANYSVSEGGGFINIIVTRGGDTTAPASVRYLTGDTTDANFRCDPNTSGQPTSVASRKCDYHIAVGTLRFAAGEATKQLALSIVNDVYVEGPETFNLTLTNAAGTTLGQNTIAPVTILDDDTVGTPNPIDNTSFFVRQLYVDLLSREPDPAGWNGWITRIDQCGQLGQPPPPCDRVTVAGDGFLRSGEFFDRQFFVLRLYRTSLGRILRYDEVGDLAFVSGFLTDAELELNKQDLVTEFVNRPEFANRYNPLSNAGFVSTLLATAGVTVPQSVQDDWVLKLDTNAKTRAQVFREISERQEVSSKYAHEAQVVSAYYGFFSRNPDGAYLNFLQRLDSGEITLGDLANAFVNAAEYRSRFGQ